MLKCSRGNEQYKTNFGFNAKKNYGWHEKKSHQGRKITLLL